MSFCREFGASINVFQHGFQSHTRAETPFVPVEGLWRAADAMWLGTALEFVSVLRGSDPAASVTETNAHQGCGRRS